MHQCKYCNKTTKSKFCSNQCQQNFQREQTIQEWKTNPLTGVKPSGVLRSPIRFYILEKFDHKCCLCGWAEINPVTQKAPLEIDHIDGDSSNNSEENLRLLCPNCHALTPTWKALNKGKGNKSRLRYSKLI